MRAFLHHFRDCALFSALAALAFAPFEVSGIELFAQSPAPAHDAVVQPAGASARIAQTQPPAAAEPPLITESELRQRLLGQTFYLRGGYLDNSLRFNERGLLSSTSPQASYTLSMVEIEKVHLDKHKLELEGVRYGLHFLGGLPSVDPAQSADKVRLTPKKRLLKITIDREELVKLKKQKPAKADNANNGLTKLATLPRQPLADELAQSAPQSDPLADRHGNTATNSTAHANQLLKNALDNILAHGMDDRMIASLPDYWKAYYQAAASKSGWQPIQASIFRQNSVDQKAKLVSAIEPTSNEYAQTNGVAGIAMYQVVVSPDGKPEEVMVGRPIGFGLDENAVAAIRKASFQPAMKDGKPVPVLLDMLVQFRIYSKRTAAIANQEAGTEDPNKPAPSLPGPYSVKQP